MNIEPGRIINDFIEPNRRQYAIPVYQRNYTWTPEREVKQYLNDLCRVLRGEYKNHFMGIIIYLEKAIDFSLSV